MSARDFRGADLTSGDAAGPRLDGEPDAAKPVTWRAAPRLHRLALVAITGIAAAVLAREAALLLLAAPVLAVLAMAGRARRPASLDGRAGASVARCFEGEDVEVTAAVSGLVDEVTFRLDPASTVALTRSRATQPVVGSPATARWVVTLRAWGRRGPGTVTARCRVAGVWEADLTLHPPTLEIFPHPPPARATLLPADLLLRIGDHAAAAPGAGIEFAGIRGYQAGDRLRDINWPVTSRTGALMVNQRAALRAADLVIMIDAFSEVGPAGDTTLDLAVRGAAGLASAYLRTGDRVGVVALGGVLRWLGPAPGYRQFFKIVEMTFGIRFPSEVIPDLGRVPRTALPPRSLVVLFSPLLDNRVFGAITDLRQRGVSLVIVDVLRHDPPPHAGSPLSALAVRLWRLDRRALRASLGVPVLDWGSETALNSAFAPLERRRIPAMRA